MPIHNMFNFLHDYKANIHFSDDELGKCCMLCSSKYSILLNFVHIKLEFMILDFCEIQL